jgi:hypothetical protein
MRTDDLMALAARLEAAVESDWDTDMSDEGTGVVEYTYYSEGQGQGMIYGSNAADFIRAVAQREGTK